MSLFLFDAEKYALGDIAQIIREQIAEPYPFSDNLRTAVMYCPKIMTSGEFAQAAVLAGIHPGTARNRFSEVRRQQREDGEI